MLKEGVTVLGDPGIALDDEVAGEHVATISISHGLN